MSDPSPDVSGIATAAFEKVTFFFYCKNNKSLTLFSLLFLLQMFPKEKQS